MYTFAETELLLRTAVNLSDNSVKQIAAAAGIKANTIYKWTSNENVHLSPQKADALLLYFLENEPKAIVAAVLLNYVLELLYVYLSSSTDEEVTMGE